jgi:flagellar motor switch protein FliM
VTVPSHVPAPTRVRARRRLGGSLEELAVDYDFRRPTTLSREHTRPLEVALETFSRQATTVLTSTLREICTVSMTSVAQQTHGEYVQTLSTQTYMTLLSISPVPGVAAFEMPITAAMLCVDHLLGGPGGTEQPERPLTEIEGALVHDLVARLLGELRYAFEAIVDWDPTITGLEYNPQFAQAASASEPMVVATFELKFGDIDSTATLCIPLAGFLPHLAAANSPDVMTDHDRQLQRRAADQMAQSFAAVPIDVSVRLRTTKVEPSALVDLAPGDVIRLHHPSAAPFDITAESVSSKEPLVFAHATAGTRGKRMACIVVSAAHQSSTSRELS